MELWRKNLYVLWGTQFLAMMGMNLVVPFLPFFIRQLGISAQDDLAQWSGLIFAGPFLVSIFTTPIWGNLGDRYGRKIMVVRAIFGLAVSQALMGFSQNVYQLFLFRMVQGAISGFVSSSLALVSTNTPRERIGYALGLLQAASAAGTVLGPLVGGILADLIGYREIFFITATLCVISGVVVVFNVNEISGTTCRTGQFSVVENYRLMYTDKRLRIVGAALIVGQASILMIEPIFALFIESFRSDTRYVSTLAGGIFSVSGLFMVISAPWWGKRNDRMGYRKNLAAALGIAGISYAGHIIVSNLIQLAFLRAFLGFAIGGVLPSLYSMVSLYSPLERRGGMIAVASSLTILGNMIGPIMGGFVAGSFGITASFAANSCMLLIMCLIVLKQLSETAPARHPVHFSESPANPQV